MNITINSKNNIKIEMKEQLLNIIDIFTLAEGYDIEEIAISPAQKHLREVNLDCKSLGIERSGIFHSIVHMLYWIMKWARPDLETVIIFLCTRISKSDKDDWKNLRRVIAFFKATINEVRRIGADDLSKIYT